jgi:hypothetical protein
LPERLDEFLRLPRVCVRELGVGVEVAVEPGVAVFSGVPVAWGWVVAVLVGSGVTVLTTGEGNGEGSAVCAGGAVAVDVGAVVGAVVGAEVVVAAGAVVVAAVVASGLGVAT